MNSTLIETSLARTAWPSQKNDWRRDLVAICQSPTAKAWGFFLGDGGSGKTVLTGDGPLRIDVPRDRSGSSEPLLIPKHERRFTGFDDKIVAMYARGMTMREIQGFLLESYGTQVSAEFISSVTDAVMAEVTEWQSRPLEAMYPVVFFDALRVKIREDAVVRNKAIYLALGVLADGTRDILACGSPMFPLAPITRTGRAASTERNSSFTGPAGPPLNKRIVSSVVLEPGPDVSDGASSNTGRNVLGLRHFAVADVKAIVVAKTPPLRPQAKANLWPCGSRTRRHGMARLGRPVVCPSTGKTASSSIPVSANLRTTSSCGNEK